MCGFPPPHGENPHESIPTCTNRPLWPFWTRGLPSSPCKSFTKLTIMFFTECNEQKIKTHSATLNVFTERASANLPLVQIKVQSAEYRRASIVVNKIDFRSLQFIRHCCTVFVISTAPPRQNNLTSEFITLARKTNWLHASCHCEWRLQFDQSNVVGSSSSVNENENQVSYSQLNLFVIHL